MQLVHLILLQRIDRLQLAQILATTKVVDL